MQKRPAPNVDEALIGGGLRGNAADRPVFATVIEVRGVNAVGTLPIAIDDGEGHVRCGLSRYFCNDDLTDGPLMTVMLGDCRIGRLQIPGEWIAAYGEGSRSPHAGAVAKACRSPLHSVDGLWNLR
jgi:hypothetical protein